MQHAPPLRALINSANSSTNRIFGIWVCPAGKQRLYHVFVVLVNGMHHQLDAFLRTSKSIIRNCSSAPTIIFVGLRTHTLTHRRTYTPSPSPSPSLYTDACFHKYTHTPPGQTLFWKLISMPPSVSALMQALLSMIKAHMSGVAPPCP